MARNEATTPGANVTSHEAILQVLDGIILRKKPIRARHTGRIRRGASAPWYYLPRGRDSFIAAEFLTHHGNIANLTKLVTDDQYGTTLEDLQDFLKKTPLTECNKGRVENAINRIVEARNAATAKAELAAGHSGGNGTTGELHKIIAAEQGAGTLATVGGQGGRRRLRSGQ